MGGFGWRPARQQMASDRSGLRRHWKHAGQQQDYPQEKGKNLHGTMVHNNLHFYKIFCRNEQVFVEFLPVPFYAYTTILIITNLPGNTVEKPLKSQNPRLTF
jgi:hypothetical protein